MSTTITIDAAAAVVVVVSVEDFFLLLTDRKTEPGCTAGITENPMREPGLQPEGHRFKPPYKIKCPQATRLLHGELRSDE